MIIGRFFLSICYPSSLFSFLLSCYFACFYYYWKCSTHSVALHQDRHCFQQCYEHDILHTLLQILSVPSGRVVELSSDSLPFLLGRTFTLVNWSQGSPLSPEVIPLFYKQVLERDCSSGLLSVPLLVWNSIALKTS